jgi:hypothetical protein
MRRTLSTLLLALVVLGALPFEALGQTARGEVVEIRLKDGSLIVGRIVSEDGGRAVIKTVAGADVSVERDQIKSIQRTAGAVVQGEFWTEDVVDSKLFLGPTGRSLKRGEGYVAIDSIFLPVFQIGVTDRFSIGMGAPFYGFVKSAWITPKLQVYEDEKTAVSTGVLHLFVPDFGLGGYGYVVATRGTANASVTFGGGMLYGRDRNDDASAVPMFTVGGERRLGRRTKFVTENYIFQEGVIATAGARVIGQMTSFEAGAIVTIIDDGGAFPGFFFNFVFHSRPRGGR